MSTDDAQNRPESGDLPENDLGHRGWPEDNAVAAVTLYGNLCSECWSGNLDSCDRLLVVRECIMAGLVQRPVAEWAKKRRGL